MILPIYAGLERLPDSLLEASATSARTAGRTFRSVVLPMVFPAIVAGSIFTFSLSLGDYITVKIVGGANQMLGNLVYDNVGAANNLPFAAAVAHDPGRDHVGLPARGAPHRRAGQPVTTLSSGRARSCCGGHRRSSSPSSTCRCWSCWSTRFDADKTFALAAARLHAASGGAGVAQRRAREPRCSTSACRSALCATVGRAGARHAWSRRAAALPVLRPRRRVAARDHAADRAARHRHRHRAEQRLPHRSSASSSGCSRSSSRTRRSAS